MKTPDYRDGDPGRVPNPSRDAPQPAKPAGSARDPDAVASAEEQAQAAALAQALDKGPATPASAELGEALETAALLAQSSHASMPEPGRVLDAVLPALQARRPRRRWWLWPAIAVPAAATMLFLGTATMMMSRSSPRMAAYVEARPTTTPSPEPVAVAVAPTLPRAPLPLLRAQAELARGNRSALATLDAEMRRYRTNFYASREGL
jgi:hypothetical protein